MKKLGTILLTIVLALAVFGCTNKEPATTDDPVDTEDPATADAVVKASFFEQARFNRFDYVPFFAEGEEPELNALLMYAFIIGGEADTLTADYVEVVADTYFGLKAVQHASTEEWTYDDDGFYTATGWSYNLEPYAALIDIKEQKETGYTTCTATYVLYGFAESLIENMGNVENYEPTAAEQRVLDKMAAESLTFDEAVKAMIVSGDTADFNPIGTFTLCYDQGDAGDILFRWHEASYN